MKRPISVLTAALLLTGAFLAGSARADVIYLTNGRSLRGRITVRSAGMTTIQLDNGGRLTIPSEQIESVEPLEPQPIRRPVVKPVESADPAQPAEGTKPEQTAQPGQPPAAAGDKPSKPADGRAAAGDGEKGPDPAETQRRAAELAPRIRELIEQLGTEGADNDDKRAAANGELATIGEPAAELLVGALNDASPLRRELAAGLLGQIGSKRSAKPLLKALDETTPERGSVTVGEQLVLNAMAGAFNKITGQFFPYDPRDIEDARIVIGQMQAWWQENAAKFPDQIGEAPREPRPEDGAGKPEGAATGGETKPAAATAKTEPPAAATPAAAAGKGAAEAGAGAGAPEKGAAAGAAPSGEAQ